MGWPHCCKFIMEVVGYYFCAFSFLVCSGLWVMPEFVHSLIEMRGTILLKSGRKWWPHSGYCYAGLGDCRYNVASICRKFSCILNSNFHHLKWSSVVSYWCRLEPFILLSLHLLVSMTDGISILVKYLAIIYLLFLCYLGIFVTFQKMNIW